MCGVVGLVQTRADHKSEQHVRAMLQTLSHRGPDDEGIWINPQANVMLGQRRLAIIDLSSEGHQPMLSDSARYSISYNGEIYNYKELRLELEAKGFKFRSQTDTEVLLKGFEAWGSSVLEKLVGMFAFAIWDQVEKSLFLARDRAGEKPLYYSHSSSGFAFASELQALKQLPWVSSSIDQDALSLYLVHQSVPAPYSIYEDIKKIEPAHAMIVTNNTIKTWRYWNPLDFVTKPSSKLSEQDATDELEKLLIQAVKEQMVSDVPLGAFLSGGIDSSLVVALMTELSASTVKTFTIGFDIDAYNEAHHAQAVADHLGTDHYAKYLSQQVTIETIPKLPSIYAEPFADASALPTFLVSQVAREQVTVSLSGDGGDEAFGGYRRYDTLERFERYRFDRLALLRPLLKVMPGRFGRMAHYAGLSAKDINLDLFQRFSPQEATELIGNLAQHATYEEAWASTKNMPYRRRVTVADMMTYMPETILTKVDRAAMAVSLETRAPLLDHRVLEFSLSLPNSYLDNKRLLKNILYKRIPKVLLERPKQGFSVPLKSWLRTVLSETMQDALAKEQLERLGIGNTSLVNKLIKEHLAKEQDHSSTLWTLFALSNWFFAQTENKQFASLPLLNLKNVDNTKMSSDYRSLD